MYGEFKARPIEFVTWRSIGNAQKDEFLEHCKEFTSLLEEANGVHQRNSILAGKRLLMIKNTEVWKYVRRTSDEYDSYHELYLKDAFEMFCERYFNVSKSTVYALIEVYVKFGREDGTVVPMYRNFNYSQLVEMCSLPNEIVKTIDPSMSVAQIRALKATLKKQDKEKEADKEPVKSEKKDEKPPADKEVFHNMTRKKDEFRTLTKQFFEKFGYKLTLCGRSQGGQAFGSSFFNYLQERGFFNHEDTREQLPVPTEITGPNLPKR